MMRLRSHSSGVSHPSWLWRRLRLCQISRYSKIALARFGAGFVNPILSAVILERAPLAVRGRVVALIRAASIALTPIGGLLGAS